MLIKTNESMGPYFGGEFKLPKRGHISKVLLFSDYIAAIYLPMMDSVSETYEDLGPMKAVALGWGIAGFQEELRRTHRH